LIFLKVGSFNKAVNYF